MTNEIGFNRFLTYSFLGHYEAQVVNASLELKSYRWRKKVEKIRIKRAESFDRQLNELNGTAHIVARKFVHDGILVFLDE